MASTHPMNKYREQVQPAIKSKVEEFHLLGYDRAKENEVWDCLIKKKWKKKEEKLLHEIVNDILRLSVNDYMTYLSMQALTGADWFAQQEAQ